MPIAVTKLYGGSNLSPPCYARPGCVQTVPASPGASFKNNTSWGAQGRLKNAAPSPRTYKNNHDHKNHCHAPARQGAQQPAHANPGAFHHGSRASTAPVAAGSIAAYRHNTKNASSTGGRPADTAKWRGKDAATMRRTWSSHSGSSNNSNSSISNNRSQGSSLAAPMTNVHPGATHTKFGAERTWSSNSSSSNSSNSDNRSQGSNHNRKTHHHAPAFQGAQQPARANTAVFTPGSRTSSASLAAAKTPSHHPATHNTKDASTTGGRPAETTNWRGQRSWSSNSNRHTMAPTPKLYRRYGVNSSEPIDEQDPPMSILRPTSTEPCAALCRDRTTFASASSTGNSVETAAKTANDQKATAPQQQQQQQQAPLQSAPMMPHAAQMPPQPQMQAWAQPHGHMHANANQHWIEQMWLHQLHMHQQHMHQLYMHQQHMQQQHMQQQHMQPQPHYQYCYQPQWMAGQAQYTAVA